MADTDRLRAAADRMDELVRYAGDNPGMASWAAQNAATAAVLRTVADVHQPLRFKHDVIACSSDDHLWPCATAAAALALADAILAGAK